MASQKDPNSGADQKEAQMKAKTDRASEKRNDAPKSAPVVFTDWASI